MDFTEVKAVLGPRFAKHADFVQKIVSEMPLDDGSTVLDVGTGWGTMAIILALHGLRVITGEPADAHWADWKAHAALAKVDALIEFRPFEAERLPFAANQFEHVFALNSLHHIGDRAQAIHEFFRVVKPGGYVAIIEVNQAGAAEIRQAKPGHPEAIDPRDWYTRPMVSLKIYQGDILTAFVYQKDHVAAR